MLTVFVISLMNALGCQYFDIMTFNVHGSLVEARGIGKELGMGGATKLTVDHANKRKLPSVAFYD